MVKKASNWFKENEVVIGWIIAGIVYGGGIFMALSNDVQANTAADQVRDEKDKQHDKRLNDYQVTLKEMSDAINRIDKNVVEIKTDLKYKKDKGDK